MNARRYIAALLICCFSAYLGHNLVPHHHHAEVYHSPVASDCPFEHEDPHDHDHDGDEHPTHCHAFNDVVFEKYTTPVVRPWTGILQTMMIPGQVQLPVEDQDQSPIKYVALKLPCKSAIHLGSRDLRAPPLLA